jgi:hypothetical protein
MSLEDSQDRILFTFDSRVLIKMMEREQKELMQVAYLWPWYVMVLHSYTVKLQETKSHTHINDRFFLCILIFVALGSRQYVKILN